MQNIITIWLVKTMIFKFNSNEYCKIFIGSWIFEGLSEESVQHLCSSSLEGESDNTQPTHHSELGLQIMEITSEKILARHYL